MEGILIPYFILLMFALAVMILLDLINDDWGGEVRKKNWQILAGFFSAIIVLIFINVLFPTDQHRPIDPSSSAGYILIFVLVILFIIPFLLLLYNFRLFQRKGIFLDFSKKQLKDVNKLFAIITVISLIVSIIGIILIYDIPSFSGQLSFGEAGERISGLFGEVISDPLFQFTAGLILFSAVARAVPNRFAQMGGAMAMVFMPMLLWLEYLFSPTPQEILDFFLGWEIIAKSFQILVASLGITFLLAGSNIIIGLVRGSI
jgi:hypothetical protein